MALKGELESSDADSDSVHFTVSDTGIGIPQDKQSSIFDPFSQGDTSTTRKYGGTGLGLTISARFIALMGAQSGCKVKLTKVRNSTSSFL